jgi:hypothetical protein
MNYEAYYIIFPNYLIFPRLKYSPQNFMLRHIQYLFFSGVKDQILHPYKSG